MGRFEIEIGKEMDVVKNAGYVEEHLQDIVLSLLSEKPMSTSELTSAIFHKYGISVNPEKIGPLLESLRNQGLIVEAKRGLLTVYSVLDEPKGDRDYHK